MRAVRVEEFVTPELGIALDDKIRQILALEFLHPAPQIFLRRTLFQNVDGLIARNRDDQLVAEHPRLREKSPVAFVQAVKYAERENLNHRRAVIVSAA